MKSQRKSIFEREGAQRSISVLYVKNGYTSKEKVIWAFTSLANIDKNVLMITLPTNSVNNPVTQLPSYPLVYGTIDYFNSKLNFLII